MKIGILMCGHTIPDVVDKHGDYDGMFAQLLSGYDLTFQAYDVENMDFPSGAGDADGWLISGSKHGVYEDHPFIAPLEDLIREAHDQKIPMVGICFGHQIIAQALGGQVEKFSGGWAVGRQEYAFDTLGAMHLNAWHQDQVITPPQGASTAASNDFCAHAALTYGDHIFTIQPHPEFSGDLIRDYVHLRRDGPGGYPPALMDRALAKADKPNDEAVVAGEIARFLLAAHAARAEVTHG